VLFYDNHYYTSTSCLGLLSLFSLCFFQVSEFLFTYGSLRHLVGLLGRGISPTPRPLPTQDNTTQHNTEKHRHTSMLRAGFEPPIPMFERPKTVRALDRAAIGTGLCPGQMVIKQGISYWNIHNIPNQRISCLQNIHLFLLLKQSSAQISSA
jgi:hypothetical protein